MIKNHSRLLILSYLYQFQLPLNQFTLVILDRSKNPFDRFFFSNEIKVYHAKGMRVFSKSYTLEEVKDTITDFVLSLGKRMILSLKDFTYEILDPYYLKDIRDQSFQKLLIIPIFENSCVGYALFYLNSEVDDSSIKEAGLLQLIQEINDDEIECIKESLNQFLFEKINPCWSIEKEKRVLISPSLLQKGHNPIMSIEEFESISNDLLVIEDFDFLNLKLTLYQTQEEENSGVSIFDDINNHGCSEPFTICYLQYQGWDIVPFLDQLSDIKLQFRTISAEVKEVFKMNDNIFILFIDDMIDKRLLERMKRTLSNYRMIYLRSKKDFNYKMDLKQLMYYIQSSDIESFDKTKYQEYRKRQSEQVFVRDVANSMNNQIEVSSILNSKTNKSIGNYITLQDSKTFNQLNEIMQLRIFKALQKEKIEFPFLKIDASTLHSRSIWQGLNKLSINYQKDFALIICNAQTSFPEEYLYRLQKLGFDIYIDSSIFLSLKLSPSFPLIKGIFIIESEIDMINGSYLGDIINYFIQQNKRIICEKNPTIMNEQIYMIE